MIFTIDPEFIAKVFERYQQGLDALPDEWGAEYWEESLHSGEWGAEYGKTYDLRNSRSTFL